MYCLNNPLAYIDPTGLEWRRHDETGALKWYKDDDDRTGTTEWTEMQYGIGNNRFVQLNANGPDANGSSQEARQGWSIYNMPSMQAGQPDNTGSLQLLFEYLTGTGPTDRQFGPSDYMTQGMMTSPDVATHRQDFIDQGGGTYGPTGVWFGAGWGVPFGAEDGFIRAGTNMPRQFVGSFEITITEQRNGDAMFVIDNATTLKSLLYQIPGVQPVERSTMAPLSNKTQTYFWTERGVIRP